MIHYELVASSGRIRGDVGGFEHLFDGHGRQNGGQVTRYYGHAAENRVVAIASRNVSKG
jgi:hypothetical protein